MTSSSRVKSYGSSRALQVGPAEDVDGDQVDAGLAHQRDVLAPHPGVPLLGVVVAAEVDAAVFVAGSIDRCCVVARGRFTGLRTSTLASVCTCTDFGEEDRL